MNNDQKNCLAKFATAIAMTIPNIHCSLSNFALNTSSRRAISALVAKSSCDLTIALTTASACSCGMPDVRNSLTSSCVSNVIVLMVESFQSWLSLSRMYLYVNYQLIKRYPFQLSSVFLPWYFFSQNKAVCSGAASFFFGWNNSNHPVWQSLTNLKIILNAFWLKKLNELCRFKNSLCVMYFKFLRFMILAFFLTASFLDSDPGFDFFLARIWVDFFRFPPEFVPLAASGHSVRKICKMSWNNEQNPTSFIRWIFRIYAAKASCIFFSYDRIGVLGVRTQEGSGKPIAAEESKTKGMRSIPPHWQLYPPMALICR